jgi:hypothetical protein
MRSNFLLVAVLAFYSNLLHAQELIDYVGSMRLGQGYDLINGKLKQNDCIKPVDPVEEKKYPSLDSKFSFVEILNSESMRRFLQVNAAASYNDVSGSAEGKMEFVNAVESHNSTSSFSFRHVVRSAETSADHWDYPGAQKRIAKDPSLFKAECGTHHIKAILYGGEFYGTITQSVKSEDERTAFKAAASASIGSMTTDLGVQTELERSTFSSTLRAEGKKAGGNDKIKYALAELRKEIADFRPQVGRKHFPISVLLVENPIPPVTVKATALEEAANILLRYKDTEKQLDAIEMNPSIYYINENVSSTVVAKIRTLLRNNRNLVISTMERCKTANEKNSKLLCDLSRIPFASPPSVNQLAKIYRSTCDPTFTPATLEDGAFIALPRVSGDESMGGQDVAAATIQYSGEKGGFVKRNIKLRIVETRPNYTQFAKEAESIVWSETLYPGCTIKNSFSLPPVDAGSPFPLGGDGNTAVNDYMALPFNDASKYLLSATCRSNQMGGDDGYVGCKTFQFRPINLELQHVELKRGDPPELSVPDWLANPSSSRAYLKELRDPRSN